MIDKVLQRSYVTARAELIADATEGPAAEVPHDLLADPDALDEDLRAPLSEEEIEQAATELRRVARAERDAPATPAPVTEEDERRGDEALPLEERSYFPRDAIASLAQSALEAYLREQRPDLLQPVEGGDSRRAAGEGDPVADAHLEVTAELGSDEDRRLAGEFEITDPGWAKSLFSMGVRLLRRRRKFKEEAAPPQDLDPEARVLLVGDWASGHPRAQTVAHLMRQRIEQAVASGRQVHVVHLGDTYYSGWKKEYDNHFLNFWPVAPGEPHGSWSCNGNHDMYTGGHAFFDHLLLDPRFADQDRSSYFSLENEHWQLLGLDTAWEDHGLKAPQADWIDRKRADHPKRKTMLLSHHQLFSEYGSDGRKIEEKLGRQLAEKPVEAWFWGHEHKLIQFERGHRNVGYARCIGHGGVPVYVDLRDRKFPARWRDTRYHATLAGLEKWSLFGFAVLDFRGAEVDVSYINEWDQESTPMETIA